VPDSFGFSEVAQSKARDYLYSGLASSAAKGISIFLLALLGLSLQVSIGLEKAIAAYVNEPPLVVLFFTLIGLAVYWVLSLPFDYHRGYVLEHKFAVSNESLSSWFRDNLKMTALTDLMALAFVQGIYGFMRMDLTYWWFYLWAVTAIAVAFFMYVSPVLIMPLFYKFPKLENEELLDRLSKLAEKAGVKILGVFEMKTGGKTRKAIAALTGIANTRRMLLSDTFLANYSNDETESVMAHEIGHHVHGHIWKLTLGLTSMIFVMLLVTSLVLPATSHFFGFERFDSVATLPLFALILGLLYVAFTPLMNTISRTAEGQCDQYELELAEKPEAYISSMTKLCDQNLRLADPSALIELLFYDHPSGKKRVKRAIAYKRLRGL
jgi:STE24 endopeptidase